MNKNGEKPVIPGNPNESQMPDNVDKMMNFGWSGCWNFLDFKENMIVQKAKKKGREYQVQRLCWYIK